MSFNIYDINEEHKIHLRISSFAMNIIKDDMTRFENDKITNFINNIITNFYEDADASLSISLKKYRDYWNDSFSYLDSKSRELVLSNTEKKHILNQQSRFIQDKYSTSLKLRLNNSNYMYLTSDIDCNENLYYPSISKYISALIEEYCSKNYLERERIYFKDKFMLLEKAITEKLQLKVTMKNRCSYHINPYKILTDNQSMYHYLVGIDDDIITDEFSKKIISYRISNLLTITVLKKTIFFSKEKIINIEDTINKKNVPFLSSSLVHAKIIFTDEGISKYNKIFHLRPNYTKKVNNIYYFDCTDTQLIFYFFKFGNDALIIEPLELAVRLKTMYEKATLSYTDIIDNL